jgi:ribosomal protein L16 Arg81 hydroxylase
MVEFGIDELLAPIGRKEFFSQYWETKPLVVTRGNADYYRNVFSLDAVDAILSTTDLRLPAFRLVKNGSEIPSNEYTTDYRWGGDLVTGAVDVDRVMALYSEGATIVLQILHRSWPTISQVCRKLEKQISHPVHANAYLTPKGSQGFAAHYDTHDVFILQVSGAKRWRLYGAGADRPHKSQGFVRDAWSNTKCDTDLLLRAGDVIYIPRGFVHEGITTDSHSLHITLGIPSVTWVDVFSEALAFAVDKPEFRQSLPMGFAECDAVSPELQQKMHDLFRAFVDKLDMAALVGAATIKYLKSVPPSRRGLLVALESQLESMHGPFLRRPNVVRQVERLNDRLLLRFEGKTITLPTYCEAALAYIDAAEKPFDPNSLPGLITPEGKLVLLRRLMIEGYIV